MSTGAWARAWGESWGLSWGLTYEANQDDLREYGGTTKQKREAWLKPIREALIVGTGAALVLGRSGGRVRAVAEEERQGVRVLGSGAMLSLCTPFGVVRAAQHARVFGAGTQLRLRVVGGSAHCGGAVCATGAQLAMQAGEGDVASGAGAKSVGARLSLIPGTLDDICGVQNPSDEELLMLLAITLRRAA